MRSLIPILLAAVFAVFAAFGADDPNDWQTRAGGARSFDVASIRLDDAGAFEPPNFPLDAGDAFANTRTHELPHGRFQAGFTLSTYITFAYKLTLRPAQMERMMSTAPKWAAADRYRIVARAEGDPTKDQMRLMMQALLADRFHLGLHFEMRDTPVLLLTLVRAGKTGPALKAHSEGPLCDAPPSPQLFLPPCGVYGMNIGPAKTRIGGSRDTTIERFAAVLPTFGELDRPVIDRTGLAGSWDFRLEWLPEPPAGAPPPTEGDGQGPSFIQALREQLGLKLESTTAPVRTPVIDSVERPTGN